MYIYIYEFNHSPYPTFGRDQQANHILLPPSNEAPECNGSNPQNVMDLTQIDHLEKHYCQPWFNKPPLIKWGRPPKLS